MHSNTNFLNWVWLSILKIWYVTALESSFRSCPTTADWASSLSATHRRHCAPSAGSTSPSASTSPPTFTDCNTRQAPTFTPLSNSLLKYEFFFLPFLANYDLTLKFWLFFTRKKQYKSNKTCLFKWKSLHQ